MKNQKEERKSLHRMERELGVMQSLTDSMTKVRDEYVELNKSNPRLAKHVGSTVAASILTAVAQHLLESRDKNYRFEDIL